MGVRCTLLPIFLAFLSTGVPSLGRGATSTSTRSVAASLPASPSAPVAEPAAGVSPGLRVYLDCDDCDILYFQKEIGFVDFVRERAVADVHTLVTNQSTGGGGDEITLTFIGRRAFVGIDDTLRVFTQPAESDQQVDSHIAQRMRLGLVRYLARTPDAELLRVERDTKSKKQAAAETPAHDPWNGWIFSIDLKRFFEGESGRRSIETSSRISVSRVTSRDKWRFDVETSYDEDRYDYEDYQSFSATEISERPALLAQDEFSIRIIGDTEELMLAIYGKHDLFVKIMIRKADREDMITLLHLQCSGHGKSDLKARIYVCFAPYLLAVEQQYHLLLDETILQIDSYFRQSQQSLCAQSTFIMREMANTIPISYVLYFVHPGRMSWGFIW